MNHMKEVAQMLGVEFGEEFEIEGREGNFRISNDGIEVFDEINVDKYGWCTVSGNVYVDLLVRGFGIIKKPWIPKYGEMVWTLDGKLVTETSVSGFAPDVAALALGWHFHTREDAEAHAPEIQEQMRRILAGELRAELVEAQK